MKTTTISLRSNSHIAAVLNELKDRKSHSFSKTKAKMKKAGVVHFRTLLKRLTEILLDNTREYVHIDYANDTVKIEKVVRGQMKLNIRASRAGIKRTPEPEVKKKTGKTVSKKSSGKSAATSAKTKQKQANAKARKQVANALSDDEMLEVA